MASKRAKCDPNGAKNGYFLPSPQKNTKIARLLGASTQIPWSPPAGAPKPPSTIVRFEAKTKDVRFAAKDFKMCPR